VHLRSSAESSPCNAGAPRIAAWQRWRFWIVLEDVRLSLVGMSEGAGRAIVALIREELSFDRKGQARTGSDQRPPDQLLSVQTQAGEVKITDARVRENGHEDGLAVATAGAKHRGLRQKACEFAGNFQSPGVWPSSPPKPGNPRPVSTCRR
jgi:hypothetical protein